MCKERDISQKIDFEHIIDFAEQKCRNITKPDPPLTVWTPAWNTNYAAPCLTTAT